MRYIRGDESQVRITLYPGAQRQYLPVAFSVFQKIVRHIRFFEGFIQGPSAQNRLSC